MKLYRHYKQKYYKLYGIAKHSETLTDVAYYECLYENTAGQFWVRPDELFFGNIELNGKTVPRFEEVKLQIQPPLPADKNQLKELKLFFDSLAGHDRENSPFEQLPEEKTLFISKALIEDQLVAALISYRLTSHIFHNVWGGVTPALQRLGIASDLLGTQLDWCLANGYTHLRTQIPNTFTPALHLHLTQGFTIVGTDPKDPTKDPNGPAQELLINFIKKLM
ncbi:MAG: hypothetical protein RJB66_502 [Pseudomonadota bacterium]|jgi:GNAT superfamily N-acetyltransferase